jgi:hypothetical protein
MSSVPVELRGPTLETTGAHAGRACVAIAIADGGKQLSPTDLLRELRELDSLRCYRVVVTGDRAADLWTDEFAVPLRRAGFRIFLHCDGTHAPRGAVDWLAITPRRGKTLGAHQADEVRVVADASTTLDELDDHAARWRCDHYLVQPRTRDDLAWTVQLVGARPRWRLSVELENIPAELSPAVGAPQKDLEPGAEAETTLLA